MKTFFRVMDWFFDGWDELLEDLDFQYFSRIRRIFSW